MWLGFFPTDLQGKDVGKLPGQGGGFKYFLFSAKLEMIQFDEHSFQNGLVQPPTSGALMMMAWCCISFVLFLHRSGSKSLSPVWQNATGYPIYINLSGSKNMSLLVVGYRYPK